MMSVTLASPPIAETEVSEQRFVMEGIRWDVYVTICDALEEHSGVRMIYNDGRLIFVGKSRLHEQLAEFLGHLVMAVAAYLEIDCEPSGEATFRLRKKAAGLEGDRTFHFGANAERMRGLRNYDFEVDPPPDLAIEVEASHPADDAIAAWGRLGVPEVWRFDAATSTCTFWNRRDGETYEQVVRSKFLPMLDPSDVVFQLRLVAELGSSNWYRQLEDWVRDVIRPRLEGGAS
jgi:Uma2 family endonuclease